MKGLPAVYAQVEKGTISDHVLKFEITDHTIPNICSHVSIQR